MPPFRHCRRNRGSARPNETSPDVSIDRSVWIELCAINDIEHSQAKLQRTSLFGFSPDMSAKVQRSSTAYTVNCCQQGLAIHCLGNKQTAKTVVHRLLKILLAAEISLSKQYGGVSQQKLNLFDLAGVYVAEFRAWSARSCGAIRQRQDVEYSESSSCGGLLIFERRPLLKRGVKRKQMTHAHQWAYCQNGVTLPRDSYASA